MRSFCDAFQRNADGSWICLESVSIQGPAGRIEASPGRTYRRGAKVGGVDLAEFLDIEDLVRAETAAMLARRARRYSLGAHGIA
jgi:hypothetical protein